MKRSEIELSKSYQPKQAPAYWRRLRECGECSERLPLLLYDTVAAASRALRAGPMAPQEWRSSPQCLCEAAEGSLAKIKEKVRGADSDVSFIARKIKEPPVSKQKKKRDDFKECVCVVRRAILRGEEYGMEVKRVVYVMEVNGAEVVREGYTREGDPIYPATAPEEGSRKRRKREVPGPGALERAEEGPLKLVVLVVQGRILPLDRWLLKRNEKMSSQENRGAPRHAELRMLADLLRICLSENTPTLRKECLFVKEEYERLKIVFSDVRITKPADELGEMGFVLAIMELLFPMYTSMERSKVYLKLLSVPRFTSEAFREAFKSLDSDGFSMDLVARIAGAVQGKEWPRRYAEVLASLKAKAGRP